MIRSAESESRCSVALGCQRRIVGEGGSPRQFPLGCATQSLPFAAQGRTPALAMRGRRTSTGSQPIPRSPRSAGWDQQFRGHVLPRSGRRKARTEGGAIPQDCATGAEPFFGWMSEPLDLAGMLPRISPQPRNSTECLAGPRDEAGEVLGVSVAVTDITSRKQAERALRDSDALKRKQTRLYLHEQPVRSSECGV